MLFKFEGNKIVFTTTKNKAMPLHYNITVTKSFNNATIKNINLFLK